MKNISPEFKAHLAQENTTIITCWKAVLANGSGIKGFSNHTKKIYYEGVTYLPSTGYTPSAIETMSGLQVDNLEVEGMLSSDTISEADIMAGVWDFAQIEIFQINYKDLSMGKMIQRVGHLGEVRVGRDVFTAELRGLTQAFSKTIGDLYSVTCRASLGDNKCRVGLYLYSVNHLIIGVESQSHFLLNSRSQTTEYYSGGVLHWLTGLNAGVSMEIKSSTPGVIITILPMPRIVSVGDTFRAVKGCNKSFKTCRDVFNNVLNFRGEPHIPGLDRILTPGRR